MFRRSAGPQSSVGHSWRMRALGYTGTLLCTESISCRGSFIRVYVTDLPSSLWLPSPFIIHSMSLLTHATSTCSCQTPADTTPGPPTLARRTIPAFVRMIDSFSYTCDGTEVDQLTCITRHRLTTAHVGWVESSRPLRVNSLAFFNVPSAQMGFLGRVARFFNPVRVRLEGAPPRGWEKEENGGVTKPQISLGEAHWTRVEEVKWMSYCVGCHKDRRY